jgi:Skp1 family, dimerisation domain
MSFEEKEVVGLDEIIIEEEKKSNNNTSYVLISKEYELFTISFRAMSQSSLLLTLSQDIIDSNHVALNETPSYVLKEIVDYLEHHSKQEYPITSFQKPIQSNQLHKIVTDTHDLSLAQKLIQNHTFWANILYEANRLGISSLLDFGLSIFACAIYKKTPKQIADILHIIPDFSPLEQEQIKKKNRWYFK